MGGRIEYLIEGPMKAPEIRNETVEEEEEIKKNETEKAKS